MSVRTAFNIFTVCSMSMRTAFNIFTVFSFLLHCKKETMRQISDYYRSTKMRNIKEGKILYSIVTLEINLGQFWRPNFLHS
jgi:hypothetical protein